MRDGVVDVPRPDWLPPADAAPGGRPPEKEARMILQALNELYQRLVEDEESGIPLRGFSRQPVPFALEIDRDGTLKQVLDLRSHDGKKLAPRQLIVPATVKRSVGIAANFLWDSMG
jgi:CRISPR-associated protein Csd1